jgi:hypothetical protein
MRIVSYISWSNRVLRAIRDTIPVFTGHSTVLLWEQKYLIRKKCTEKKDPENFSIGHVTLSFSLGIRTGIENKSVSADTDNLYRAEIRCFMSTAAKTIRYNPFCPIAIEPVALDNFRK